MATLIYRWVLESCVKSDDAMYCWCTLICSVLNYASKWVLKISSYAHTCSCLWGQLIQFKSDCIIRSILKTDTNDYPCPHSCCRKEYCNLFILFVCMSVCGCFLESSGSINRKLSMPQNTKIIIPSCCPFVRTLVAVDIDDTSWLTRLQSPMDIHYSLGICHCDKWKLAYILW